MRSEVIILGTGLAGAAAAIRLSQLGKHVTLIGSPRSGALQAGESLPSSALRVLRTLGISHLSELLSQDDYLECNTHASAWGEERWSYRDNIRNPEGSSWHLLRERFDHALRTHAQKQGVLLIDQPAQQLASNGQHYRLTLANGQEVESNWLIDATGRAGWVSRRMLGSPKRYSQQYAAVAWLERTPDDLDRSTRIKSCADGWWYTAPIPDNKRVIAFHGLPETVGRCAQQPNQLLKTANQLELLTSQLAHTQLIQTKAYDASFKRSARAVGPRWLAAGDAAISMDPLSSQGMFFALYSGLKAAEAAAFGLENLSAPYEAAQQYQHRLNEIFRANQQARALFYQSEPRFRNSPYWKSQKCQ